MRLGRLPRSALTCGSASPPNRRTIRLLQLAFGSAVVGDLSAAAAGSVRGFRRLSLDCRDPQSIQQDRSGHRPGRKAVPTGSDAPDNRGQSLREAPRPEEVGHRAPALYAGVTNGIASLSQLGVPRRADSDLNHLLAALAGVTVDMRQVVEIWPNSSVLGGRLKLDVEKVAVFSVLVGRDMGKTSVQARGRRLHDPPGAANAAASRSAAVNTALTVSPAAHSASWPPSLRSITQSTWSTMAPSSRRPSVELTT